MYFWYSAIVSLVGFGKGDTFVFYLSMSDEDQLNKNVIKQTKESIYLEAGAFVGYGRVKKDEIHRGVGGYIRY